jgi:hypothetical protein
MLQGALLGSLMGTMTKMNADQMGGETKMNVSRTGLWVLLHKPDCLPKL